MEGEKGFCICLLTNLWRNVSRTLNFPLYAPSPRLVLARNQFVFIPNPLFKVRPKNWSGDRGPVFPKCWFNPNTRCTREHPVPPHLTNIGSPVEYQCSFGFFLPCAMHSPPPPPQPRLASNWNGGMGEGGGGRRPLTGEDQGGSCREVHFL